MRAANARLSPRWADATRAACPSASAGAIGRMRPTSMGGAPAVCAANVRGSESMRGATAPVGVRGGNGLAGRLHHSPPAARGANMDGPQTVVRYHSYMLLFRGEPK